MIQLFLLLCTLKPVFPLEEICPIAQLDNFDCILNIDEICGPWRDDGPSRVREGVCFLPRRIDVWENGCQYIFSGKVIILEREENQTVKTFIGKTKKTLVLWTVLV